MCGPPLECDARPGTQDCQLFHKLLCGAAAPLSANSTGSANRANLETSSDHVAANFGGTMDIGSGPPGTANDTVPGAPRHAGGLVVVLSRDLFFGMRIRTSLRQLDYAVALAQDPPSFTAHLRQGDQVAALGLIDFNQPVDWKALSPAIAEGIPIIAFGPHKDIDGFRAARAAGVTRTIANGEFSRSLPDLVARYAKTPDDR